jgi:hypothetical protein
MSRSYLCAGCDRSIHWFCAKGDSEVNETKGHGAHYWCADCYQTKGPGAGNCRQPKPGDVLRASSAKQSQPTSRSQSTSAARGITAAAPSNNFNFPASQSTSRLQLTSAAGGITGAAPSNNFAAPASEPTSRSQSTSAARGITGAAPPNNFAAPASQPTSRSQSTSAAGGITAAAPPNNFPASQPTSRSQSTSAAGGITAAASPNNFAALASQSTSAGNKKKNTTPTKVQRMEKSKKQKSSSTEESRRMLQAANGDPFIGQVVAFLCSSEVGKMLIDSFRENWVDGARCPLICKDHGHIVGVIMMQTKDARSKNTNAYDIAWEHTLLGETSVSSAYHIGGIQTGTQIATLRQQCTTAVNNTTCSSERSKKNLVLEPNELISCAKH